MASQAREVRTLKNELKKLRGELRFGKEKQENELKKLRGELQFEKEKQKNAEEEAKNRQRENDYDLRLSRLKEAHSKAKTRLFRLMYVLMCFVWVRGVKKTVDWFKLLKASEASKMKVQKRKEHDQKMKAMS
jgi:hypothetical protein